MKSKVYYSKNNFNKIIEKLPDNLKGKTGIKVHVGEPGNITYLDPKYPKAVYEKLKKNNPDVSLVECNVLYRGDRSNRVGHLKTAKSHGYDFAPLDICDGEKGDDSWEIPIKGKHFSSVFVGENLNKYDNLITVSHFKGHPANGFGGALKNLGMGLGSRQGKMAMHKAFDLKIDEDSCLGCGICAEKCGADAISIVGGKAKIDFDKCLRCAGCITNCPNGAVATPWGGTSSEELQERIVEYCFGITQNINCPVYINVMEKITNKCDCYDEVMDPIAPDLGYLFSTDPVAIDQASYDLLKKALSKDVFKELHKVDSTKQMKYGEKLGLGSREYELIEL